MKRGGLRCILAALAAALLSGACTSIRVSHVGKPMIEVENTGWLLFNFIPIASGNPDNPGGHMCRLFQNTVTLDNNIELVNHAIRREQAVGVRDLVTYTSDEHVLVLLFKRISMHTSAELVMGDDLEGLMDVHLIDPRKQRDPDKVEVKTVSQDVRDEPRTRFESPDERPPEPAKLKILNF